ncbi:peptidoglycan DD-metalloendopeptidase family protein [Lewinella sp. IMCC34183]|uniref:peptidoglycan DD-metalloendopeptidase family protein n=1 Tax=Lewinella sp. IMCC34183 TaxID=2248762 RepID=UPI000E22A657|nr:M23 family metallopeptidase [Lewinella sp. IMCC34183]
MSPRKHQTRSLWRLLIPLLVIGLYVGGGCSELRDRLRAWVDQTFGEVTPRQAYRWHSPFGENVMARWDTSYARALRDTLTVSLPHREEFGTDTAVQFSAQSLHLRLPPGRELVVQSLDTTGPRPFGELYHLGEGPPDRLGAWDTLTGVLVYEAHEAGGEDLLFLLQRRPLDSLPYSVALYTRPLLAFPVAGGDAGSIRSFWGDRRDGGRRRHEGNDIFAPRGTPLVAVTDGRVGRVRNGGLGGKTIWLRDDERRLNYYYAHLDSQLVRSGQRVSRGDTIGWVGNTGNARTTPPHLHFGIYANGARDPYPYLRPGDATPARPRERPGQIMEVPQRGVHYLRRTPQRDGEVLRQLEGGEKIRDLATTGAFHRVHTRIGETGYVNFD